MLKNYKEFNDNELLWMVQEESEDAKDILYNKYQYLINLIVKKYTPACYKLNIEYKDFYQEALLGFADALNNYDETKEASLATFITICVERKLRSIIQKASTQKNKIAQDSLSIDYFYEDKNAALLELIGDDNKSNPLMNIASQEYIEELLNSCRSKLSPFEREVFELMISEYDYNEIATILSKSPKVIDNTMQRVKRKIKAIVSMLGEDK